MAGWDIAASTLSKIRARIRVDLDTAASAGKNGLEGQLALVGGRVEGLALGVQGEGKGDIENLALPFLGRHALVTWEDREGDTLHRGFATALERSAALGTGEGVDHESTLRVSNMSLGHCTRHQDR